MSSVDLIDRAGDIRAGEELDTDRLRDYLEPILGPVAKTLEVTQFPGGHSNLTYLLSAGSQRWVLRRPPFGSKVKSAHDMSREYRILSALKDVFAFGPVPEHFCDDHEIIGCDFYLMNCIEGLVIRREYPAGLQLSPTQIRQQLLNFFDVLADLHSVDLVAAGLTASGGQRVMCVVRLKAGVAAGPTPQRRIRLTLTLPCSGCTTICLQKVARPA